MHSVQPTGASHEVPTTGLFFSTTDARGIIKQANSVFVEMSRYRRDDLMGAPHNIIRHPAMPGGAFLLMWQTLQAGKPFCAYVDNLASDGSCYTVFATITPLGEDYLSVRIRPGRTDLLETARGLYSATRPLELEKRAEGASAHESAVFGLNRLAQLLGEASIPSYDAFIQVALPAEVAERSTTLPSRPAEGPLGNLLAEAHRLHRAIGGWVSRLDELQALADALVAGVEELQRASEASKTAADEISRTLDRADGFSPLTGMLSLWTQMTPEIEAQLTPLGERLKLLWSRTADTRFRIALAALHSEALAQFVCELIDHIPGSEEAKPAITDLVRALQEGVAEASAALEDHAELAVTVADEAQQIVSLMRIPTTVLAAWQGMAAGQEDAIAALLPTASEVVNRGILDAERLLTLAERCHSVDVGSPSAVLFHLHAVQQSASNLHI